jgi:Flp pilus assembly protein TadD
MAGALRATRAGTAPDLDDHEGGSLLRAETLFNEAAKRLDQGLYAWAEGCFRNVLRLLPDHASTLNNLGTAIWRQGRLKEAEAFYRQALLHDPNDYAILNNLGNVLWEQGRLHEALRWLRPAVALRPDSAVGLMNLGVTLSDLGEFAEALGYIRESIRLLPGSPESHVNLGNTLARQGNLDEALACYEQALSLRRDFPDAHRYRAYLWLAHGDYERGWPELEWRLECAKPRMPKVSSPRWTGDDLTGRSILLVAEQGLGDVLQFIRFAPLVKQRGGEVVLACPEPLVRLAACCPGIDRVVDWNSTLPACDVHAHLMSLPMILGTTLENLPRNPCLSVDETDIQDWRPIVARALSHLPGRGPIDATDKARDFTIGIAWQGNRSNTVDRWRSFPLAYFAHLAELPGVRLISLQMGDGTEQVAELAGRFPVAELSLDNDGEEPRRDFLDTAAVMSQLDLVVAPESAVAHLAGSLGCRVWVPLSSVGDWRWMVEREDSPWYPTMRLFRQTTPGDWEGVFERMVEALACDRSYRPGFRCKRQPT